MARKKVERNISYDDVRKVYYVSMDLGRDENGKRIKQYRTYPNISSARAGLKEFHAEKKQQQKPSVPVAGVLDGHHCPAQPGGDHRVRLPEDH